MALRLVEEAFAVDRLAVKSEHRAFAGLERHDEPNAMAIFRHVPDADQRVRPAGCARAAGVGSPSMRISPPLKRPDAGERLEKLRLAVAGDAGDAQNLALAQNEGDAVDACDAAVVAHHKVTRLERDWARMRRALFDLQDDLAPDHRVGELGRRGAGGVESRDHLPAPHHRHAVGQAHDLAQLVGDEDDRLVLALEHAQHFEQLVRFGRRQHCGRLVEHQDLGAPHQRLQDFDPLLEADRQLADDGVGVDLEGVFLAKFGEPLANCAGALSEHRPAFGPKHHVFEHAERVEPA